MTNPQIVLLTAAVCGAIVTIVYILARYNYLIRRAIIDEGGDPYAGRTRYSFLDMGCILLGVGIGLALAAYISTLDLTEDTMDLLIYAALLICGGTGLVVAHLLRHRI